MIERYPASSVVPEAIYFRGVNLYKQKNDSKRLKMAYEELRQNYPNNGWTKKAAPYLFF
ncbi:MAG: TolA-binding protein [Desulforhopalus sp.]|jgi:TolA-binding protein